MAAETLVATERQNGVTIISFGSSQSTIRGAIPDELGRALLDVVQSGGENLLFDMNHVEFCNSTLIEMLVRCWNRVKSHPGHHFALCHVHPYCKEVLDVTNLTEVWKIYPDRDSALDAFQAHV